MLETFHYLELRSQRLRIFDRTAIRPYNNDISVDAIIRLRIIIRLLTRNSRYVIYTRHDSYIRLNKAETNDFHHSYHKSRLYLS